MANILVLADPTSVYLYAGLTKPQDVQTIEDKKENALIEIMSLADYTQRIQTLFHDLATGHFYEKKRFFFDPDQTVDSWLLDAFQVEWLKQVSLESVLQLADYRHLLFHNAKAPAFIAHFKNLPLQPAHHMIEYTAPKFNRDGLRQGIVTVNPS